MAKKKKTRQQKIAADLRRQLFKKTLSQQEDQAPLSNSVLEKKYPAEITVEKKETGESYNYLIADLKKTAFLTTSIITLQIILYLALTNKILILPGLSY